MVRRLRQDYPGAWHHIGNRGLARRGVFEAGRDVAAFLGLVNEASQAGLVELHAYSFMTNHFHLLVRSPAGRIGGAMKHVENAYVRIFNRVRGRDGPLFRSRYWNRIIESGPYWSCVVRYIDRNPVAAGLAARSIDFPHGSAWWYARGGGPACLRKEVVEGCFGSGASYPVEERGAGPAEEDEFVRLRATWKAEGADPLEELLRAPAAWVEDWLRRRARTADGGPGSWVLVGAAHMMEALALHPLAPDPVAGSPAPALVRLYCGLTLKECGRRFGLSVSTVARAVDRHRERMAADADYSGRVARVLMAALRGQFGPEGVRRYPSLAAR